jgi:chemotaxis methyl-accepting protein methylase
MTSTSNIAVIDAASVLARRVGLRLDPSDRGRLSRCVVAESDARALDIQKYVELIDDDPAALQELLNRVTVQETDFFRDAAQFDALAQHVLPGLPGPLTVWSAGCANGQEAYSVAMVLDELGRTDARVIATDVSTRALARARGATYSEAEIRGLSAARRDRYLLSADRRFEVVPTLRRRVDFLRHNLSADPPPFPVATCPVVLCRNVLIYFSREEVEAFLERLADWLPPDGWLFLGYSESLWQVTERFQLIRVGEAFVYQRRDGRPTQAAKKLDLFDAPRPTRHARRVAEKSAAEPIVMRPVRPVHVESPPIDVVELLALGEAASQAGDHAAAIATFRKYAYLDPDQPLAHFYLGVALEASGDASAARRAYGVARATLQASGTAAVEATLEGYHADELAHLLEAKLETAR